MKTCQYIVFVFSFFYPFAGFAQQTAADFAKSGDAKEQKGD